MYGQSLGLVLIAVAIAAVAVRLAARGRPGWRLAGQIATVVIVLELIWLVAFVSQSALRGMD